MDVLCRGINDHCSGCHSCEIFNDFSQLRLQESSKTDSEMLLRERACLETTCEKCKSVIGLNFYYENFELHCIICKTLLKVNTLTGTATHASSKNLATFWRSENKSVINSNETDPFSATTMSGHSMAISASTSHTQLSNKLRVINKIPRRVSRTVGTMVGVNSQQQQQQEEHPTMSSLLVKEKSEPKKRKTPAKKTSKKKATAAAAAAATTTVAEPEHKPLVIPASTTSSIHAPTSESLPTLDLDDLNNALKPLQQLAEEESTPSKRPTKKAKTPVKSEKPKKPVTTEKRKKSVEAKPRVNAEENKSALNTLKCEGMDFLKLLLDRFIANGKVDSKDVPKWNERFLTLWLAYLSHRNNLSNSEIADKLKSHVPALVYIVALDLAYPWNCKIFTNLLENENDKLLTDTYREIKKVLRDQGFDLKMPAEQLALNYIPFVVQTALEKRCTNPERIAELQRKCENTFSVWAKPPYNIVHELFLLDRTRSERKEDEEESSVEAMNAALAKSLEMLDPSKAGTVKKQKKRGKTMQRAILGNSEWVVPAVICVYQVLHKNSDIGTDLFKNKTFQDTMEIAAKKFDRAKKFLPLHISKVDNAMKANR